MLDAVESRIDGVVVGTPDHTHTVVAMNAMKRGKHVYCEKPLAHSVWEVRQLMKAARETKVVTQLGNQGHSSEHIRLFVEWVRDGAIGQVRTVHAGCGAFKNVYCQIDKLPELKKRPEVPKSLDWDLWLGPAEDRPYSPVFVPWNWRGWTPFGTGCIGDWVCHVVDPAFWALDLGSPESVKAEVEGYDPKKHHLCYPPATKITYTFPAKGTRGPVTLIWYDGKNTIPRPEELEKKRRVPNTGAVVVGSKGQIMHGSHGAGGCRIIPEDAMKAYKRPEKTIPRTRGHHEDWVDAVREGRKAGSDFAEYGGPLTEVALLGMIAVWYPTQTLRWDTETMQFTNFSEANKHITPQYREGWTL
jgi:predicted dehydrogenase